MVTCNLCKKNKQIEDMQNPFRYVCKACWDVVKIEIEGQEIDKEIIY